MSPGFANKETKSRPSKAVAILKGGARERTQFSAKGEACRRKRSRADFAPTLERVFLQHLSKKARNINGFRTFGKWHFSEKTVFDRLILGRFMF